MSRREEGGAKELRERISVKDREFGRTCIPDQMKRDEGSHVYSTRKDIGMYKVDTNLNSSNDKGVYIYDEAYIQFSTPIFWFFSDLSTRNLFRSPNLLLNVQKGGDSAFLGSAVAILLFTPGRFGNAGQRRAIDGSKPAITRACAEGRWRRKGSGRTARTGTGSRRSTRFAGAGDCSEESFFQPRAAKSWVIGVFRGDDGPERVAMGVVDSLKAAGVDFNLIRVGLRESGI
jgi:hypothetical protein